MLKYIISQTTHFHLSCRLGRKECSNFVYVYFLQVIIKLTCTLLLFCGVYLSFYYGVITLAELVQGDPVEAVVVSNTADVILKLTEKDSNVATITYSYNTKNDDVKEEITIKENTYLIDVNGQAAILSDNTAHTIGETVYVNSLTTTTCPVYRHTINPEAEPSSGKFLNSIVFLCIAISGSFGLSRIDLFLEDLHRNERSY